MQVRVKRSFTTFVGGQIMTRSEGEVFELPASVDWLRAGLVEPVEPEPETPPEESKGKRRSRKASDGS